jgi:hypothetical protein
MTHHDIAIDRTRMSGDHLAVVYTYRNASDTTALIHCLLPDLFGVSGHRLLDRNTSADAPLTPEIAFMRWDGGDGFVLLQGHARADSPAVNPLWIGALAIGPGERFRAAIRVPLPVVEWDPEVAPARAPTIRQEVRRIALWLDCTPGNAASPLRLVAKAELPRSVSLLRRRDPLPHLGGVA